MSYRKHLMTSDEPPSELYKAAEVGTNLAEVGTDLISRKSVIDALHTWFRDGFDEDKWWNSTHVLAAIEGIPPAEPNKDKVSNLLYHIYSIQSPHLDMNGVIAKKYYCEELWKELFGKESELPKWMT